jgi:hypothetical protein
MPMVFVKLLVERASELLEKEGSMEQLPASFVTLVDEWVAELLLNDPADIAAARLAALAALLPELSPAWRSRAKYLRTIDEVRFERLLLSGLLEKSGLQTDPLYKFALDPISEYLAALEMASQVREKKLDPMLEERLAAMTIDDIPAGFRKALVESARQLDVMLPLGTNLQVHAPEVFDRPPQPFLCPRQPSMRRLTTV